MKRDLIYIKKQAEKLIDTYALTIPVHVFELTDLMGIKWVTTSGERLKNTIHQHLHRNTLFENSEDIYGYFDHQRKTIYLNDENQHITRKRFTLAHEIGHIILHEHLKNNISTVFLRQDIVSPRNDLEAEANYFAGYLLMPDKNIEERLKFTVLMTSPTEIVNTFAKTFAVSPEAMRIRLKTYKNEHPEIWTQYKMEEKLF